MTKKKTSAAPPAVMGRPSSYKPEYAAQATKIAALGATDAELADIFGVAIRTINLWKHMHPDFGAALKPGKDIADDRVERSLYQRAIGYSHDAVKVFLTPAKSAKVGTGKKAKIEHIPAQPVIVPYRQHISPDTTACIFWLKNRRPDLWRDVQRHEVESVDNSQTAAQLRAEIVAELKECGLMPEQVGMGTGIAPAKNGRSRTH